MKLVILLNPYIKLIELQEDESKRLIFKIIMNVLHKQLRKEKYNKIKIKYYKKKRMSAFKKWYLL